MCGAVEFHRFHFGGALSPLGSIFRVASITISESKPTLLHLVRPNRYAASVSLKNIWVNDTLTSEDRKQHKFRALGDYSLGVRSRGLPILDLASHSPVLPGI